MATINIFNAMRTSINLQTYVPVNDLMDQDADLNFVRTRYVPNTQVTLSPGVNAVDTGFWSSWSAANPTSTLLTSHTIFPA
jgi:hypothetical protein